MAGASPQQKLQSAAGGSVVQLFRYPGLTASKAKTLLRRAQDKASPNITGIDAELVRQNHRLLGALWMPRCQQGCADVVLL